VLIGIPKETAPQECRVAATPDAVKKLRAGGFGVAVQTGAGVLSRFADADYREAGATIVDDPWNADVVMKVRPPSLDEAARLRTGGVLISTLFPDQNEELVEALSARGVTAIALDKIPRISRAQRLDVLSSMANIAGYRAIIEAVTRLPRFMNGQITAAGKTPPAKVLIIGTGVAGLAAIATARGLGAIVRAFDVRPACKEQVESLGAEFLMLDLPLEGGETAGGYAQVMSDEFIAAEMDLFAAQCQEVDVVITTALIPGRRAPILITADMVRSLKPGSVVVDLAAEQGGNCEGTIAGEAVEVDGVTLVGFTDLTSRLPTHASQFFSNNLVNLMDELGGPSEWKIDVGNEVVRKSLVTRDGEITWPPPPDPPKTAPSGPPRPSRDAETPASPTRDQAPPPSEPAELPATTSSPEPRGRSPMAALGTLVVALVLAAMGQWAPADFIQHFTVFVLACFVGWQVVWNVTPALHTPLMSVTNAISGIIIVGGILQAGSGEMNVAAILGAIAILVASINIFGGFLVTHRMLQMFRREG